MKITRRRLKNIIETSLEDQEDALVALGMLDDEENESPRLGVSSSSSSSKDSEEDVDEPAQVTQPSAGSQPVQSQASSSPSSSSQSQSSSSSSSSGGRSPAPKGSRQQPRPDSRLPSSSTNIPSGGQNPKRRPPPKKGSAAPKSSGSKGNSGKSGLKTGPSSKKKNEVKMKITHDKLRKIIREELSLVREYTFNDEAYRGANLVKQYLKDYNANKHDGDPEKGILLPREVHPLSKHSADFYKAFSRLVSSGNLGGYYQVGEEFVQDMSDAGIEYLEKQIDTMQCLAGDSTDTGSGHTGSYGNDC